ncbi:mechanosensitive ion channel family protein [Candidatus Binatus sp.]|uniref:mechanosensitive ion channel family protein n=2 Tax=Candidatus Binatus sp. TaxID=2811406 RepID=UPI003C39FE4D
MPFEGEAGTLSLALNDRTQRYAPGRVARSFAILLLLAAVAGLARSRVALAQSEGAAATDASLIASERQVVTAPVVIDGRLLFRVRGVTAFPAADRAATIAQRIRAVAEDRAIPPSALHLVANDHWTEIVGGENSIMGVFDADAAAEAPGLSRQALAHIYLKTISSALQQYRAEREPAQLAHNAVSIAGWTLLLVLVELAMFGGLRSMTVRIGQRYDSAIEHIETGTFRLIRAESIWVAMRFALRLFALIAALAIFYVYLHIVLDYLPWTRALGANLRGLTLAPLLLLARESLAAIPRLLVLCVIIATARYIVRLARFFFSAIESGTIKFSGFETEWSKPTYNIVRVLIIAFAAMVCYPYIPGSGSQAFKGITIFIGVLFSLGSSSLLANIIAGYTMAYRRAFHVGDRITVGDLMGDVIQIGLMVTHMRSIKNEELVVPNSVILNSNVINYSSLARERGLILHTTVGIGYETPWRQVEAMLLMAAERTPGLLREPAPFVLQLSLNDFAVTYQLNVYCAQPSEMYRLYTELHRSVLDVFNEYGVQIMTPAYIADPAEPKVVPREQWFANPAEAATPLKISRNA